MREIRTLRAMWRGLETGSRSGFQGTYVECSIIQCLRGRRMFDGNKCIAHLSGLPLESCLKPFFPLGISGCPDGFVVFHLVLDDRVKNYCDFMGGRRDRRAGPQPRFHPAQVTAHRSRAVVQGRSGQTEQVASTVLDNSHSSPQRFAAADVVVWTKTKATKQSAPRWAISPCLGPPR